MFISEGRTEISVIIIIPRFNLEINYVTGKSGTQLKINPATLSCWKDVSENFNTVTLA